MLRAAGSSVLLPPPPLSFFNQMACSGVGRIKTAAATADDSVQFWKAHKHMHTRTTQERTAASERASTRAHTHTRKFLLYASDLAQAQSALIYTCMHRHYRGINICMSYPRCMHIQYRPTQSFTQKRTLHIETWYLSLSLLPPLAFSVSHSTLSASGQQQ